MKASHSGKKEKGRERREEGERGREARGEKRDLLMSRYIVRKMKKKKELETQTILGFRPMCK